jgi:hypothetical protein
LILPPGHGQSLNVQRRLRSREKWMIGGVLGTVAVLIVATVIALGAGGHKSGNGCIDVTIAAATGGTEIYQCGVDARATCASRGTPGSYTGEAAQTIAAQCRKAGLPVAPQA